MIKKVTITSDKLVFNYTFKSKKQHDMAIIEVLAVLKRHGGVSDVKVSKEQLNEFGKALAKHVYEKYNPPEVTKKINKEINETFGKVTCSKCKSIGMIGEQFAIETKGHMEPYVGYTVDNFLVTCNNCGFVEKL